MSRIGSSYSIAAPAGDIVFGAVGQFRRGGGREAEEADRLAVPFVRLGRVACGNRRSGRRATQIFTGSSPGSISRSSSRQSARAAVDQPRHQAARRTARRRPSGSPARRCAAPRARPTARRRCPRGNRGCDDQTRRRDVQRGQRCLASAAPEADHQVISADADARRMLEMPVQQRPPAEVQQCLSVGRLADRRQGCLPVGAHARRQASQPTGSPKVQHLFIVAVRDRSCSDLSLT